MRKVINTVLEAEEVDIDKGVIDGIIQSSEGCPRQALIILDQIIDMDEDDMLEGIRAAQIEEKQIIDLCRALINPKNEWNKISSIIKNVESEPEKARKSVMGYCNSILLSESKKGSDITIKERAALIIEYFKDPFYSDKPLLTLACFNVFFDK
jgi:DNA polymerase III gamma/tau subunit